MSHDILAAMPDLCSGIFAAKANRLAVAALLVWAAAAHAAPLYDALVAIGRGDFAGAAALLTPLANAGDGVAEYRLGVLYAKGEGVPQDSVLAYMWWTLADAHGDPDAVYDRDDIEGTMTLAQLADAQRLAAEWMPMPAP
jgi:TPR repeat protein